MKRFFNVFSIISFLILSLCSPIPISAINPSVRVTYQGHVQNISWQPAVNDGALVGTTGRSLRLEAFRAKLDNAPLGGSIRYEVHVQNLGWMDPVLDGQTAGTEGRALRMEAVKISLVNMPGYSVQYRAHVQYEGWQAWVSDGAIAGTTGYSLRLEAIEVRIINIPTSLTLSKTIDILNVGSTDTLVPTILPSNATNKSVSWISSNPAVATVDSAGLVTAISAGTTTVIATTVLGNISATCDVIVIEPVVLVPVSAITVTGNAVVGATLTAVTTPSVATGTYQWKSSDIVGGTYTNIALATNATYTLVAGDATKFVKATFTASNSYTGTITSAATGAIAKADVTSNTFTVSGMHKTVTVTLTDGTFKTGAMVASDFTFTGEDAGAFAIGVFTRTSDNVVTITGLTFAGSWDNTVLVKATTQATQATSVSAVASTAAAYTYTTDANNKVTITGYIGSDTEITIPSTLGGNPVTIIKAGAFMNKTTLTSIIIPNSVTSIGDYAFYNCTSLISVTIGSGVTSIGAGAFQNCTSLTSIIIPNSVTSIGNYAFNGCTKLISIIIPNSVTSIGSTAFYNCTSLTSVTIGSGVMSIGAGAFEKTGLTSIIIPNSVTSIGSTAFAFTGLTSITMGRDNTIIGINLMASANNKFKTAYTEGGAGTYTGTLTGDWTKLSTVKTVAVAGQSGTLDPINATQSATFAITTANIADGQSVTIAWFLVDGTPSSIPTDVTAVGSDISNNASTITVNVGENTTPLSYYFKATINGVTSAVVTVVVQY